MARTFFNKGNTPLNSTGKKIIQFRLFGDWDKTIRVLQRMSPAVKIAGIYAQTKICEQIKKRVQGHLKNQDLGWRPLSDKYAAEKSKHSADSRTLIAFGHYYHSIEVWHKGNEHTVFVGVKKNKYTYSVWSGQRSKIDIARIAAIHEFSLGRRIPRRPLWNPTIAEMGGAKGIKQLYVKHLVGKLRVMGIPIKQFKNIWS